MNYEIRDEGGVAVVALKGGRSEAGGAAARSHTGAIAGSYEVFRALARQTGMIEVARSDELLAVTEAVATQPPLAQPGIAVLSDGGGHATLCADHLSAAGVPIAELSANTRDALSDLLGPAAAVGNPIDAAGAADHISCPIWNFWPPQMLQQCLVPRAPIAGARLPARAAP